MGGGGLWRRAAAVAGQGTMGRVDAMNQAMSDDAVRRGERGALARRVRRVVRTVLACATALVAGALVGCFGLSTTATDKKVCLVFEPTETLNLYDGQPHSLTIFIYPLSSAEGFGQARPDDLLGGARPPGVLAPPVPFTVEPGEIERTFQDLVPAETTHLGIIADFYRAPGDPEGIRSRVVPARCGLFKPTIALSSRDLAPE